MRTYAKLSLLPLMAIGLAVALAPGVSFAGYSDEGPPRYPLVINNEVDLIRVAAAGLVGDTFGYDANEVLAQARTTGMPTEDIVPAFYVAYLAGSNFREVVELRAKRTAWGEICESLDIDADTLNSMPVPSAIRFSSPRSVPDEVLQDMFICGALATTFEIDPDRVFEWYERGWSSLDVLTAVHLAWRADRSPDEFLDGSPRDVDWYSRALSARIDLVEMAQSSGRCYDNVVPLLPEDARASDLETIYSMEVAADVYDVPIDTVRRVRYRYLYSPSDLMITFYLADLGGLDYHRVCRAYAWDHWYRWGPTITVLGIPRHHFDGWSIWVGGRVDFYGVDHFALHSALLGHALCHRNYIPVPFYDRWGPNFRPRDAILYSGVYRRHHVPFSDYERWGRSPQNRRGNSHFSRDYAEYRRNTDWVGHRRVGAIVGQKRPVAGHGPTMQAPRVVRTDGPRSSSHSRRYDGNSTGLIVGTKRPTRSAGPAPSPRRDDRSGRPSPGISGNRSRHSAGPAPSPRRDGPSGRPSPGISGNRSSHSAGPATSPRRDGPSGETGHITGRKATPERTERTNGVSEQRRRTLGQRTRVPMGNRTSVAPPPPTVSTPTRSAPVRSTVRKPSGQIHGSPGGRSVTVEAPRTAAPRTSPAPVRVTAPQYTRPTTTVKRSPVRVAAPQYNRPTTTVKRNPTRTYGTQSPTRPTRSSSTGLVTGHKRSPSVSAGSDSPSARSSSADSRKRSGKQVITGRRRR